MTILALVGCATIQSRADKAADHNAIARDYLDKGDYRHAKHHAELALKYDVYNVPARRLLEECAAKQNPYIQGAHEHVHVGRMED